MKRCPDSHNKFPSVSVISLRLYIFRFLFLSMLVGGGALRCLLVGLYVREGMVLLEFDVRHFIVYHL